MQKLIYTVVIAIASFLGLQAQEFQGMAVYESKTSTSEMKTRLEGNKNMTPDMQKMIEERMKKMFEKTFILNFNKTASIYKEEEKLEASAQGGGFRMMSSFAGGGGTYYKNVKDKQYSNDKEFMGKEFMVKDSLTSLNWKMEAETRVIGGYTCYKATAIKKPSATDFRNMRPRKDDGEKKEGAKPTEEKKTNFLDAVEVPKEIVVTAWYTPEIPVSQGPEGYWGLPGLILEVNDGRTTILCSKVVLNPKDKVEIKAITKGKVVSQKEYDDAVMKKMEEWREMNQGRGGNGGMQMRFGN
ncbi:GLPGLI family protein [Flavobacterium turcicum]|uniref:GLPGLI family protein n=1 Tax=Flavobacterium turcicum TaxID=2764718 RepID=A0ABR7JGW3_9FLAO|nr:GLPGLI family protein [Flavobacterium turcicum]MBC5863722.1 GLPGLI family protein [Flavobacterium turcicum]NHL02330.1 GLPGLI family protein [Flavobacterium turcicum]